MSTSTTRNPKELRQMVTDSASDMDEMQNNLSKLRALSEDDKNENAKLRSRIDEQCQLIMILKTKADEGTVKIQTLERINKELSEFRDQADSMLKNEIRKYDILDGRFNNLASNHEEMIRFKDEYKRVNKDLKEENARLKEENGRLFSKTIAEKDGLILELDKKCASLQQQCSTLEHKLRQNQVDWRGKEDTLRKQISELQSNSSQQMKDMLKRATDAEEKLKGTEYRLQMQLEKKKDIENEVSVKLQQVSKEKEELIALVMQRGKLIQKEQENNKSLQKKIEAAEKAVKSMENRFEREAETVNANLKVKRLAEDLADTDSKYSEMVKEFEAFKKHSNDLLKKEKELNERLRHLYA